MALAPKAAQKQLADLLFPDRASREDEEGILNVPLNERRLRTETYDFTISTIQNLLRENKIVVPDFQRKYVWKRPQASRLIEPLIIQCPIPIIYLDQEDDGTLKVIDGNQRIMSIRLFLENQYRLRGLLAFPDLNGLLFRELDQRFGKNAFRLLDAEGVAESKFNAAVYDAQMVGFALASRPVGKLSPASRREFVGRYQELQGNRDYYRAISASTSDPPLVALRIRMFKELVEAAFPPVDAIQ